MDSPSLLPLPPQDEALIPAASAPLYLGIAAQTLARWRCEGFGPPYVKLRRLVFYRAGDLRAWIGRRVCPTTLVTPRGPAAPISIEG